MLSSVLEVNEKHVKCGFPIILEGQDGFRP